MKTILIFPISLLCLALRIDSQESWVADTTSAYPATGGILYAVDFVDSNTGCVAGTGIFKTTNGGTTWTRTENSSTVYSAFKFVNANTGYAVGGGIIKTNNGGTTWTGAGQILLSGTPTAYNSVDFVNVDTGFLVGSEIQGGLMNGKVTSMICKTINGGTWNCQQLNTETNALNSIQFVNAKTGYLVGDSGTIYKTINGGNSWSKQTSGTTAKLSSVDFVDTNTGYVAGSNFNSPWGAILKTTNGGITWTSQTNPAPGNLRSVKFVNANTGYVVGDQTILETTNGGATWVTQVSVGTNAYVAVNFVDATHGWAVGENSTSQHRGIILKHTGNPTSILGGTPFAGRFGISFNAQNLSYQMTEASFVSVLMFDVNGKLTLKLLNEMEQAGYHSLPLPKAQIPGFNILDFRAEGYHKAIRLPDPVEH